MHRTIFSLLFMSIILMSCKNSSDENNLIPETYIDSTKLGADSIAANQNLTEKNHDSLLVDSTKNNELLSVTDWKIEDFIINKKDKKSEAVRRMIEYEKEQFENVKNPFVATYQGCDFGDYFHLNFEDLNGTNYDFGYGENDFGAYELYEGEMYNDNPNYLGKSFTIYWTWKIVSFPCCDGEYDLVEAYMPSITKLELVEETSDKK